MNLGDVIFTEKASKARLTQPTATARQQIRVNTTASAPIAMELSSTVADLQALTVGMQAPRKLIRIISAYVSCRYIQNASGNIYNVSHLVSPYIGQSFTANNDSKGVTSFLQVMIPNNQGTELEVICETNLSGQISLGGYINGADIARYAGVALAVNDTVIGFWTVIYEPIL